MRVGYKGTSCVLLREKEQGVERLVWVIPDETTQGTNFPTEDAARFAYRKSGVEDGTKRMELLES